MSSTATIPSDRVSRIRRIPSLYARWPYSPLPVIIDENLGGTAGEQDEPLFGYFDARANDKLLQAAIQKAVFCAAISPEPYELLSGELSTCPQYYPVKTSPERFQQLASIWKSDTKHLSDLTRICNHWAYQNIIKMGRPVIPLLLQELKTNPDYWFSALRKITGQNPVPPEARGKLKDMASAWLEWEKNNDVSW